MKNRELLELAAKAAGYEVHIWGTKGQECVARMDVRPTVRWNPLQDDGDALRLAVDLDLEVYQADDEVRKAAYVSFFVPQQDRAKIVVEHHDNHPDAYAATRLAITRAAAAIQKAKEAV